MVLLASAGEGHDVCGRPPHSSRPARSRRGRAAPSCSWSRRAKTSLDLADVNHPRARARDPPRAPRNARVGGRRPVLGARAGL